MDKAICLKCAQPMANDEGGLLCADCVQSDHKAFYNGYPLHFEIVNGEKRPRCLNCLQPLAAQYGQPFTARP